MLSDFENYIQENKLFSKEDKLLLAISGGQDSVFLFHLLLMGGYNFSVAHCNFQLRGNDSKLDEDFVKSLCDSSNITCHIKAFDTKQEAKKLKLGTQEIARKLRYDWFDELKNSENYDYVLTAHHLSDNTETMLINIMRSTGVSGLHGIQNKNGYLIRPLLYLNREQISSYLSASKIEFRLDISNENDDYLRNKIRHHIVPEFEKIEPRIDAVFSSVSKHLKEFEDLSENLLKNLWDTNVVFNNSIYSIPDTLFNNISEPNILLYYCLKNFGFNASSIKSLEPISTLELGAVIFSEDWQLTRERNGFDLRKRELNEPFSKIIYTVNDIASFNGTEITFKIVAKNEVNFKQENILFFDLQKSIFPLEIRTWRASDKMQPLGLIGHKKVSDILTDKKVKASERKSQLLLIDAEKTIMAVLPNICSEVHKISHETNEVLAICLKNH
jgi:tRNA(Ile)-lysidine synthase